jgi:hypothetical protein
MLPVGIRSTVAAAVFFMKLLGAVRTFEFMALTGNTSESNGQNEQGK